MNNRCPKCNAKLSPFYLKENCPNCNVSLLYYELDKRLEADAAQAKKETDAINRFLNIIKSSSIASPVLIARLVLFFTPLAALCLNTYNGISLITLIKGIIDGSFDLGANILVVVSIALLVVISIVVILSSLFSSTKNGLVRNLIFSIINLLVFAILGFVIGGMEIGWYIVLAILICEIVMHFVCDKIIKSKANK